MILGELCPKQEGILIQKGKSAIEGQIEKLFKHTRSGSYGTRARYRKSCEQFARFLNERFKLQNLRNLQDKHVVAYIKERQLSGMAPKTIKNDLAAIRYLHDMVPNNRYQLSQNRQLTTIHGLDIEKTHSINGDRGWTDQEYKSMKKLAESLGRTDIKDIMTLCRSMGLRIAEATAATRAQAEASLRTGIYEVRGEAKNGKWRKVPLSEEAKGVLKERLKVVERGGKLFVKYDEKTHEAINRFEKFLEQHRGKIVTEEGVEKRTHEREGETKTHNLTFHGLRYSYVQERMDEEVGKGFSNEQAASQVSKEVGHNRTEIIRTYLGQ